ncbi:MAG: TIGR02678 family protein [Alicyclobacillus sp.]|nr:TIGR02678 family protein [Alicyclobacillus sp.]
MSRDGSRVGAARRAARGAAGGSFEEVRQQAVQALLNRPYVQRQRDAELYRVIRDHYRPLRDWFHEQAGWSLVLTRQFAKLEKTPGVWQSWMAMDGFRDGRDYAYFTYGLWYLEGLNDGQQFLLTEMVEAIREHLVSVGLSVDWTLYDHRLSMARALKKLRDLDALTVVEGEESDWARSGEDDVLYQASLLSRYLLQSVPQRLLEVSTEGMLDEDIAAEVGVVLDRLEMDSSDGADVADKHALLPAETSTAVERRHAVMRRLLQEPVVYDWQWTEGQRRYVQTQRASLLERIRTFTGLEGRRYREGLLFVWPELTAEMELFPTQAVISDIVSLLAAELRRYWESDVWAADRDSDGCPTLTRSDLETILISLRQRHGAWWSKEYREKSTSALAEDVTRHLVEWNLGRSLEDGGVVLYPVFARWVGTYALEGEDEV